MNISALSTMAITEDGPKYNFRTIESISRLLHYVIYGNQNARPVFADSIGFAGGINPDFIVQEILYTQTLYKKTSGIRIRGEVVDIYKWELPDNTTQKIRTLAHRFGGYFFYQGFQTVYGIFDRRDFYKILYALNPVSYGDGSKYKHNNTNIHDEQMACLQTIVNQLNGVISEQAFDFRILEYS